MTLKSCPFCGGEAELERVWFWEEWQYHIHCTQCQARTATYRYDEEEAIEAWNARVIPEGYVKVVRCGECKFWGYPWTFEYPTGQGWCGLATIPEPISQDHYCGYGEAKEDTNDAV